MTYLLDGIVYGQTMLDQDHSRHQARTPEAAAAVDQNPFTAIELRVQGSPDVLPGLFKALVRH